MDVFEDYRIFLILLKEGVFRISCPSMSARGRKGCPGHRWTPEAGRQCCRGKWTLTPSFHVIRRSQISILSVCFCPESCRLQRLLGPGSDTAGADWEQKLNINASNWVLTSKSVQGRNGCHSPSCSLKISLDSCWILHIYRSVKNYVFIKHLVKCGFLAKSLERLPDEESHSTPLWAIFVLFCLFLPWVF